MFIFLFPHVNVAQRNVMKEGIYGKYSKEREYERVAKNGR